VRCSLTGDLVNIDGRVSVHKSLLSDISPRLSLWIREEEEKQSKVLGERKRNCSPVRLQLFEYDGIDNAAISSCAMDLWSSFLYGQSMSDPKRDDVEEKSEYEFDALFDVILVTGWIDHTDAVGAAIDAIRELMNLGVAPDNLEELLQKNPLDSPLGRMLMDFMAYRGLGWHYTTLDDSKISPTDRVIESAKQDRALEELCKMLIRKEEIGSRCGPLPDLMARYRYHSHVHRCYLLTEKEAESEEMDEVTE
jgi:hypothetical protein